MPGPFNIYDSLAFENSMVCLEFQGSPLYRRAARLILERNTTHTPGATPGQQRHLGSSHNLYRLNTTIQGLRHLNIHLLSFQLTLGL